MLSYTPIAKRALLLAMLMVPAFAETNNAYTYLALGDSISFGYDPTVNPPAPNKYTGYPEVVAFAEGLDKQKEVNASCPGETSGSFVDVTQPDNHCEGPSGFKATIGLHTSYPVSVSQLNFAISQLKSNRHINLVTLSIGGNDLLLLEQSCATAPSFPACVGASLPNVLGNYAMYLAQILYGIRNVAGYNGTLVLVNYYSPSADPLITLAVSQLNQVMMGVAAPFGAKFADAFTAFQVASLPSGGDPCAAGLLVKVPVSPMAPTGCDVHPSVLGRDLLAGTVLFTLGDLNDKTLAKIQKSH